MGIVDHHPHPGPSVAAQWRAVGDQLVPEHPALEQPMGALALGGVVPGCQHHQGQLLQRLHGIGGLHRRVIGPHRPDQPLLEQGLAGEDLGDPAEDADRQIEPSRLKGVGHAGVEAADVDLYAGRLGPDPRDQVGQQDLAGVGGGGEIEGALGLGRIELCRRQGMLQK